LDLWNEFPLAASRVTTPVSELVSDIATATVRADYASGTDVREVVAKVLVNLRDTRVEAEGRIFTLPLRSVV
jgi:hypothetical protein